MNYLKLVILLCLSSVIATGCAKVSDAELDTITLSGLCMALECHNSTQLKIYPPASGAHLQHTGLAGNGPNIPCTDCHHGYYNNPLHKNGFINGYNWIYQAQVSGLIVYWNTAKYPAAVWDDAANSCSGLPASTCHDSRVWATCKSCHIKAPPDGLGKYPPASGAHTVHRYKKYSCQVCHKNYTNQPTHNDGAVNGYVWQTGTSVPGSIVIFNAAAGALAAFSHASGDCTSLGCHGTKNWYRYTDGCTVCHQYPPLNQAYPTSGRHGQHRNEGVTDCQECHNGYASGNLLHNNGAVNGSTLDPKATAMGNIVIFSGGGTFNTSTGRCSGISCHGSEDWYGGGGD
ncbi:MAG TPA: hypothetical protein PLM53_11820 [Spirochaetota bacterium]|nr:hypothetical protein [Spirochaetota bacterium]HPL16489.1 hypothetical protein [Spirochaetota bacterium]HQF09240.1 hypothetical protein [Spirochaetota bacterium]HQH97781.1 hypothetical protein [Spirochaetota bacterium]HQJ71484.1 hypothetical protein [Spirochaetota bacterium]